MTDNLRNDLGEVMSIIYLPKRFAAARSHFPFDMKAVYDECLLFANRDDGDAAAAIAHLYANKSIDDDQSAKTALQWAEKAVGLGSAYGHWILGLIHLEEMNGVSAKRHLETSLQLGFAAAAFDLGIIYQYGLGVSVDAEVAERHYKTAQHMGHCRGRWSRYNLWISGKLGITKMLAGAVLRPFSALHWNLGAMFGDALSKESLMYGNYDLIFAKYK